MKNEDSPPAAPAGYVEDNVVMTHRLLPGEEVVQPRASLPAWAEVGWVELKSPAAPAAAKTNPSPKGDTNPEEGTK